MPKNMDDTKEQKARAIILAYSSAHATVAAILSNTIVGDAAILTPLTCLMVYQLAKLCDQDLDSAAIASLAATLFGSVDGVYLSSKLLSWIPFFGNAINASVTFGITQVIGWAAFGMFNEGMTKEDALNYEKEQEISKYDMSIIIDMSVEDKDVYINLSKRLGVAKISNDEKEGIVTKMAYLYEKYQYK